MYICIYVHILLIVYRTTRKKCNKRIIRQKGKNKNKQKKKLSFLRCVVNIILCVPFWLLTTSWCSARTWSHRRQLAYLKRGTLKQICRIYIIFRTLICSGERKASCSQYVLNKHVARECVRLGLSCTGIKLIYRIHFVIDVRRTINSCNTNRRYYILVSFSTFVYNNNCIQSKATPSTFFNYRRIIR